LLKAERIPAKRHFVVRTSDHLVFSKGRDALDMTREHKLALILGFALVLIVGVLVSDHISGTQRSVASSQSMDDPIRAIETELGPGLGQSSARSRDRAMPGFTATPEPDTSVASRGGEGIVDNLVEGMQSRIDRWNDRPTPPAATIERPGAGSESVVVEREPVSGPGEIEMGRPPVRTQVGEQRESGQRVQLHRVDRGETLWSIAQKYYGDGNLHRQLLVHNTDRVGSGGTIQPGTNLVIPSRAELTGQPAARDDRREAAAQPQAVAGRTEEAKTSRYVVKRGDVLSVIAQRELGTVRRMNEILKLNSDKISSADEIWVGLELRMPAR